VFVSYVGYQSVDTLVNLSVTSFELSKRKYGPTAGSSRKAKANTLNKSILEQKIKTETIENLVTRLLEIFKKVAGVSSLKTGSSW
jgi:iron complex outermembrane receptor protein